MKYNYIISLSILSLFILSGCSRTGGKKCKLPAAEALTADSIRIASPELLSVTSMFLVGEDTVGIYQERNDTLFSFWKLPGWELLFKAGIYGQGSSDFLTLDRTFRAQDNGFCAFEIPTGRVLGITFGKERQLDVSVQPLGLDFMLNRFLFLADSTYAFFSPDNDYEFCTYNRKEGVRYFGTYPDVIEREEGVPAFISVNKLTVAHPDGKRFAAFYANIKMCRIYDKKGVLQKETLLSPPVTQPDGSLKFFYTAQPFATADAIYLLASDEEDCILEVWNWDATLLHRYRLSAPIHKLIVCSPVVYGIHADKEEYVYAYTLPTHKLTNK